LKKIENFKYLNLKICALLNHLSTQSQQSFYDLYYKNSVVFKFNTYKHLEGMFYLNLPIPKKKVIYLFENMA